MAVRSLRFVLTGEDKSATRALDKVGKKAEGIGSRIGKVGGALAGGALAAGVIGFGKASVGAFKEAQESQARFNDAFAKFPALSDTNKQKLADYNSELAKKTRFDDDAIGSGQAVLAQFGLTGQQIKQITPLLLDYAAKTGQDLPAAAKALGLATMGNAKALKQVGIALPKNISGAKALEAAQKDVGRTEDKLTSARRKLNDVQDLLRGKTKLTTAETIRLRNAQFGVKDAEENHAISVKRLGEAQKGAGKSADVFTQIMGGLRTQVGGFAEKDGKTAVGQSEILRNQFGELQETVGSRLVPALVKVSATLLNVVDFIQRNSAVIGPLVGVLGTFVAVVWSINKAAKAYTAVQAALNIVLTANPIGLLVVALVALGAGLVLAYKKSETFRNIVNGVFSGVAKAAGVFKTVVVGYLRFVSNLWLTIVGALVNGAAKAFGWVPGIGPKLKAAAEKFNDFKDKVNNSLAGINETKTITIKAVSSTVAQTAANAGIKSGALSGSEAAASVTTRSGARAVRATGGGTTVVHTSVNLDGKTVARSVTSHQQASVRKGARPAFAP